ncbi:MAG: DUF58 domain-containing protein [Deltaproteobacteria bacterium]|nr:DUF58 domain-containing protein [Deltaproteobacteria bacterium]
MNFARLNHILIPATRDGRERIRQSFLGRVFTPIGWFYGVLSDEGRVFVVLLLFVGTAGLSVDTTQIYVLWSALFGFVLGSLAIRRAFELRSVRVAVRAPRRVAAGEIVTFEVTLASERDEPVHDVRVAGPFLPWDGRWIERPPPFAVVPPHGSARTTVRARFVARGEHQLDVFTAARLVPGGLTLGAPIDSDPVRFLVVPPLASVASLSLPVPPGSATSGGRSMLRVREGQELFGVRLYRRGDPVRELHPKTWARRGEPHVREYRPSTTERIAVALDDDSAASEEAFEAALSVVAGVVAWASEGEHDLGPLLLGTRTHPLPRRGSRATLDAALDGLAVAERAPLLEPEAWWKRVEVDLELTSVMIIVATGPAARGVAMVAEAARRGLAIRVVRVVDDRPFFGRGPLPSATFDEERVVSVRAVLAQEALRL